MSNKLISVFALHIFLHVLALLFVQCCTSLCLCQDILWSLFVQLGVFVCLSVCLSMCVSVSRYSVVTDSLFVQLVASVCLSVSVHVSVCLCLDILCSLLSNSVPLCVCLTVCVYLYLYVFLCLDILWSLFVQCCASSTLWP